jgi:hypothetical protein
LEGERASVGLSWRDAVGDDRHGRGRRECSVVTAALRRIAKDGPSIVELANFVLGVRGGIDVRVKLASALAVGPAQLVGAGVLRYAQDVIQRGHGATTPSPRSAGVFRIAEEPVDAGEGLFPAGVVGRDVRESPAGQSIA